ncbi:T9SS type A sorting domain-containing protein [Negadavirga shengliensis]|uniref:T9SS type A sorting domain-containing protein n=1 Tax=Negadavirga shengliensis TaxID=1389218 RepID=A0ABV9T8D0_9BACT
MHKKRSGYFSSKQALLPLLFFVFMEASAQNPALEFAGGDGNPTGNGPVTSTTIRFRNNIDNYSGNTFATYEPPLNISLTFVNQQFNFAGISQNAAIVFGYANGSYPIYPLLNVFGVPQNSYYTSAGAPIGMGIDVNVNRAVEIQAITTPLRVAGAPNNQRVFLADLEISFDRPVRNPIFHVAGTGGLAGSQRFAIEFDLLDSNTPIVFSKLSGTTPGLEVNSYQINNGATNPEASGNDAGSGSVLFEGDEITGITLRTYIRGNGGGNWSSNNTDPAGDGITIGFSLQESDLQITKTVDDPTPEVGANVVFTIQATNNGPSNSGEVIVEEHLPEGYSYVSHTVSTGTYDPSLGIWDIGDLNHGITQTLTITATVTSVQDYINNVRISGAIPDPIEENNTDSEETEPRTVLPVVWLYQQAEQKPEGNLIKWGTAQEKNNDKFIIYRSSDAGHTWHAVGKVDAVGQSQKQVDYEFLDTTASAYTDVYYRIKQVDEDERYDYSGVVRLKMDRLRENSFKIYPNPYRSGHLKLLMPSHVKEKKGELSLVDAWGRTKIKTNGVMDTIAEEFLEIVQNQPPGVYMIRCNTHNTLFTTKLWIH